MDEIQGTLITTESLKADFVRLGLRPGMTVIVHASFKSLGQWVAGGPVAVILALEEALDETGTLVMPTHTGDLSDPSEWVNPPVRDSWWKTIREQMPPFDVDLTPTFGMGIIAECFRKQQGVLRSVHPQVSFAARGKHARTITDNHGLSYALGEQSPLARIYDIDGWVLLLGVGHANNTSLHLAEYRADYKTKSERICKAPMKRDGVRSWIEFLELDFDSDDFTLLGEAFEHDTGLFIRGKVAGADALLARQRDLVDYAVQWLGTNRQ
ncbi:aminoglycoside N(3)-acetyltransferase [Paenibacillus mendelii]|uniref:Aminoglycoside N(3)-acetyltransferase n=1 Tax=Paenibacillus mendelii TaxID=206163 RepID=A0ABV6J8C9_9BACL|nr:AAC(3) family N-acetyltransferase [Paenibacillus mendelii]MCQ6559472.1 AAC(3) family N-acetyltransferase [Paenibacillus mendelii]